MVVSVRHFLTVPNCAEIKDKLENGYHSHSIIKVTQSDDGELTRELIDSKTNVTSQYFSTDKLQNQKLCYITTTWWGKENAVCLHSSLQNFCLTHDKDMCPHQPHSLALFCYCETVEKSFEAKIKKKDLVATNFIMELAIEKSPSASYTAVLTPANSDSETDKVTHLTLCKYNGVKQLGGAITANLGCTCHETHCRQPKLMNMKVIEMPSGIAVPYSAVLKCKLTGETETANKLHLTKSQSAPMQSLAKDVQMEAGGAQALSKALEVLRFEIPRHSNKSRTFAETCIILFNRS